MQNMAKEKRTRSEVFGDTVLDLGKLTFGGIVLAGIFDPGINKIVLISVGGVICVTAIIVGVYLITKKQEVIIYGILDFCRRNDSIRHNRSYMGGTRR